eukprot:CAMPEP_0197173460 /NCGR_PEP_ID=MMETSP1423-20130617/385_1 /TAXON_ID=476441 /ORGANISM="Pseudo-nitzschia heimii, Strain UNC1101" /LENGTH=357 /DNA_ID=CAMNT_0042622281 /DNA_START=158 /DNA_END=1231 /DNA_ORIENTATION=+
MRLIIQSCLLFSASAFIAPRSPTFSCNGKEKCSALFSTDASDEIADTPAVSVDESTSLAKEELLKLATELKDQYGLLLIDSNAKDSFRKAVEKLESVAEVPADSSLLIGDWTLMCSSSSSTASEKLKIDTSKIPFVNEGPVRDIKDTLNDSIEVLQRIKFGDASNSIDAIDHIIDYKPPNQLSSFLKNVPDAIKNLDINPFKVSETKVVLKHKAEVEGLIPVIKTKLNLQSIVVNVAGESKNLEPNGEDVLGINLPFGELLNAGSFDTTFVDESMRISRSKTGPVDQIRVFVKAENTDSKIDDADIQAIDDDLDDEIADDDLDDDEIVEGDSDSPIDAEIVDGDDDEIIEAPSDIEN